MSQLKLTHTVPIVAFDSTTVMVKNDGSFDLIFHQITDESSDTILSNVVAAVRIPDEARWQQVKKLVDDQLKEAKSIEK
jgi:hypothetical protein